LFWLLQLVFWGMEVLNVTGVIECCPSHWKLMINQGSTIIMINIVCWDMRQEVLCYMYNCIPQLGDRCALVKYSTYEKQKLIKWNVNFCKW
jgi:hypothetical protein